MPPRALSRAALNRALLARQLLLRRHELSAEKTLEHLVGLQSQAPMPPYFGLWTRLRHFVPDELVELMYQRRVVRIALMRSTVHLVSAKDCLELRNLLGPAVEKGLFTAAEKRAMSKIDSAELLKKATEYLSQQPRTNAELGALLQPHFPDQPTDSLVRQARGKLALVQVPPRGIWNKSGQTRSTTAESWLDVPLRSGSIDDLVLRYLAAFGPATAADAQKWSGLTKLSEVFIRLQPNLEVFTNDQGSQLFDLPDAPRPDSDTVTPVRFLPEFDNVLLSHADRRHIISEADRAKVFTINGIIRATILVNGMVAGLWKIAKSPESATLTIEPFRKLADTNISALIKEGNRLVKFAAPESETHHVLVKANEKQ